MLENLGEGWVAEIAECRSLHDLKKAADRIGGRVGLTGTTYTIWLNNEQCPAYFTNYPDRWAEHYLTHDLAQVDPVIAASFVGGATLWSDLARTSPWRGGRSPLYEARDFGMYEGVAAGFQDIGCHGLFSAVVDGLALRLDARDLTLRKEAATALGAVIHERAKIILIQNLPRSDLTDRQRDFVLGLTVGWGVPALAGRRPLGSADFEAMFRSVMAVLGTRNPRLVFARAALIAEAS